MNTHSNRVDPQITKLAQNWSLTPATFAQKLGRGSWIAAPHLQYISLRIAQGIMRGNARIIISLPPRHGKSELISVNTPAWVLEKFPNYRVLLTGYGADLVEGFARKTRDILADAQNIPLLKNARLRMDKKSVSEFGTVMGGYEYAVGLGGSITGRGADVLLIDDYIKEIKEALSPTQRDYIWNWFVTTAFTRLEPGGSCIIIATRWHTDDLIGRILKHFPDEWEYIEIPAIATERDINPLTGTDILGRVEGEALFPQRYPIKALEEKRRLLGKAFFEALYQQRPYDETNKLTDGGWLKVANAEEWPKKDAKISLARVWDLAASEEGGDFLVGTLCAYDRTHDEFGIVEVLRRQLSVGKVENLVIATAKADGPGVEIVIEQEPGSSGKILVESFQANPKLKGHKVTSFPVSGRGNKAARAQPFIAAAEDGRVFLLRAKWNDAFIAEFNEFPGGMFDDQVDTAAAGYTKLTGRKTFSASWGRKAVDWSKSGQGARKRAFATMNLAASRGGMSGSRTGATFGRRPS